MALAKRTSTQDPGSSGPPILLTAKHFIEVLNSKKSTGEIEKTERYVKGNGGKKNKFIGLRMKTLFDIAKSFILLPVNEIKKLLTSPYYEARMGAVCIMDFQARNKKIPEEYKKVLFDLYLGEHKHINNWDMVDRSAPWVIGGYLANKSREILYKLARSKNVHERRTAIVSTYYFIRQGEIDDTFNLAEILVYDPEESIHKAVGSWIREAGKKDKFRLTNFLEKYASTMPRVMLRYAIEKLDKNEKEHFMKK